VSGGGGTNTVQSSQPNNIVSPYLGDLYAQANDVVYPTGGPQVYPGQEVTPFNGTQNTALGQIASIGNGALGNLNPGQANVYNTATQLNAGTTAGQQGLAAAGQANGTLGNQELSALATGNSPGEQGLNSIINGTNAGQQSLAGIMNGSNQGIQTLTGIANGTNLADQYLQGTLAPSYTNVAANPNLQGALNAADYNTTLNYTNAVAPQLASQFSAAGRFGSGAQNQAGSLAQNALATQLANTNAGIANTDYMQLLGQQSANAGTLGGLQSSAGQALGQIQGTAGQNYAGNVANASGSLNSTLQGAAGSLNQNMSAANQALTNSQLSGNAALGTASQQGLVNANTLLGAGNTMQNQQQNLLNTQIAQYNQQQMQPENLVNWLTGVLSGTANIGSQSSSSTQNQVNPYTTATGLGTTIGGLYSSGAFSGLGSLLGGGTAAASSFALPAAASISAMSPAIASSILAGGVGGGSALFGLGGGALAAAPLAAASDRRLKEDIEATGEHLENGLPIYRYRYLWDAPHVRREGVMSDEVRKVVPGAVFTDQNGFDKVNYAAIGGSHLLNKFHCRYGAINHV
jgi:hypothetical protein